MDEEYRLLPAGSLHENTDFCITLDNDCMEPWFPAGQTLCVTRLQSPREFAAGVFLYKGRVLHKCRAFAISNHLRYRTSHIYIQNVVRSVLYHLYCLLHYLWLRAKELKRNRMFILMDLH